MKRLAATIMWLAGGAIGLKHQPFEYTPEGVYVPKGVESKA